MAYSYVRYTGDGSTTNFTFSFPYISQDHIKVRVNNVITTFSFVSSSIVQISPAPAVGTIVEVRRETPRNAVLIDYTNGSIFGEADLDLGELVALYHAQETQDYTDDCVRLNYQGNFDAQSARVVNADPAVDLTDLTTLGQVRTEISSAISSLTQDAVYNTEVFTATEGQTEFTLVNAYSPSNDSLAVYLNGSKLVEGLDYEETSEISFTLTIGATAGDVVVATTAQFVNPAMLPSQSVEFVQSGAGAVARSVQSKAREFVSIDDFPSVQAAVDSGHKSIFVPRLITLTGTVNITSPDIVLWGVNPDSCGFVGDGTFPLFDSTTTSFTARNIGFSDATRGFYAADNGVNADYVFDGCKFTNISLRAITHYDAVADLDGFRVINCTFTNCGSGVYVSVKNYARNVLIDGNKFVTIAGDQALSGAILIDVQDQGLTTEYKASYSIIITNNEIEDVRGVYSGGDSYTLAYGIFVVGNGVKVSGNTLTNIRTTNGNASISPIGIYTKAVNSIVDSNILIDGGGKYAIYSVGASFDQGASANGVGGNNIITDNIVTYDALTPTSDVCILTQSNHVTVSDNRLYGNTATILAFDAADASISSGRSITGNSLVSSGLIKIITVGSNVSVSNNYLEYTGAGEMRTCGAGSNLQVFNNWTIYFGDFPSASVSKAIRSVVINGNVLHSRSFVVTRTGIYGGGSGSSTTTFSTITINNNNFFNFFNPIIFADQDFANVQTSSNIGVNASTTYFGLNGLAARYTNFHKNNNVGVGTKLSDAITQRSPNGTIYYIKTDNTGARTQSTDIMV